MTGWGRARAEGAMEKHRVLLIYRDMIPSVRLCGHSQMEYLAAQGRLEYRAIHEMKLRARDIDWADIVLLGRLDSWYHYRLTRLAHGAGKYVIYIIDDDLLNVPPQIGSGYYYSRREIQGYIRGMIELSDGVISPSERLLAKYAAGKRAIRIEEPAIDPVEYRPHARTGPVKIGFAGTIDRIDDIESVLREALIQIKDDYGEGVAFEFFGAEPAFAKRLGARCVPYDASYDGYRRTLNALQWDIGLAPMPDTPFHACKHYNKFGEYAAAGIVGIFSEVYPYTRIRDFTDCALFCDNTPGDWVQALRGLIDDYDWREGCRERVIRCAKAQLGLPRVAGELAAQLPDPASLDGNGKTECRWLGPLKARNQARRLTDKARYYGATGVIEAVGKRLRRP